jgi:hypothetical protein
MNFVHTVINLMPFQEFYILDYKFKHLYVNIYIKRWICTVYMDIAD